MCLVWKTAADEKSRKENLDTEWKLNIDILAQALDIIGIKPEVDMFASRINAQFPRYASFRPDPAAEAVDSFSISWFGFLFYAFPPFCVIPSMLQKLRREKASGVVVHPDWPNQPWYAAVARMLVKRPVLVSARNYLLCLPQLPEEKHRLVKLRLIICEISGADSESQDFRTQLFQLCAPHGALGLRRCASYIQICV